MNKSLQQRTDELEEKLRKHKRDTDKAEESPRASSAKDISQAFKISSEFMAGILVGAILGWAIDHFVGTSPWGLIVFVLIGFCAGTLNVIRSSNAISAQKTEDDQKDLLQKESQNGKGQ